MGACNKDELIVNLQSCLVALLPEGCAPEVLAHKMETGTRVRARSPLDKHLDLIMDKVVPK